MKNKLGRLFFTQQFVPERHKLLWWQKRNRLREFLFAPSLALQKGRFICSMSLLEILLLAYRQRKCCAKRMQNAILPSSRRKNTACIIVH